MSRFRCRVGGAHDDDLFITIEVQADPELLLLAGIDAPDQEPVRVLHIQMPIARAASVVDRRLLVLIVVFDPR